MLIAWVMCWTCPGDFCPSEASGVVGAGVEGTVALGLIGALSASSAFSLLSTVTVGAATFASASAFASASVSISFVSATADSRNYCATRRQRYCPFSRTPSDFWRCSTQLLALFSYITRSPITDIYTSSVLAKTLGRQPPPDML